LTVIRVAAIVPVTSIDVGLPSRFHTLKVKRRSPAASWIQMERSLSSEGEIVADLSPPSFGADNKTLYYLLRHHDANAGPELWRLTLGTGKSEAVFPGTSMTSYDVSPDEKQVVYANLGRDGKSQVWLAPMTEAPPPGRSATPGKQRPTSAPGNRFYFGLQRETSIIWNR
jgi:hypothetical protein